MRITTRSVLVALMVAVAAGLSGCATALPDSRLQPKPITTEIPTLAWPDVALEVRDDRAQRPAHERLVLAVEATVRQALPAPASLPPRHHLAVAVLRHEAAFTGGGSAFWTGRTELRAVLSEAPTGDAMATWTVVDTHEEWNVWGYGSGTDAAQYSLRDALRKLLRQMAAGVRPDATQLAASSALVCRQRSRGLQLREAWLAEYRRCMEPR